MPKKTKKPTKKKKKTKSVWDAGNKLEKNFKKAVMG